jgi:hypothetical protein
MENDILKFLKKSKYLVDVDNDMIYQRAKFKLKIPYILGCIKMANSDKF